ncbi:MAG: ABC transporter substrate-binding protein [Holosporales bacterium]|jgi:putative ABC transport system substrate-binding protein|nr:ABC transporter substrate-binding protein [Holosporales bacterium]
MSKKNISICVAIIIATTAAFYCIHKKKDQPSNELPLIAIANYGPHPTLDASIRGLKEHLSAHGYIENKTVRYEISDVGFDQALIPQMISKLRDMKPLVIVVKSTPVAQFAKGKIHDIPLVYCDITDPVEVGLIKDKSQPHENITGSSDQEDLEPLLAFAKRLLPHAKTIGILYSTSDANDAALVRMMHAAAEKAGLRVIAVPVDQSRDIPVRMQKFNGNVDFIYVGTSGPIQPALPVIAAEAHKMRIPVFNAGDQAVHEGLALASFGVNYDAVGKNAGRLVEQLLKGASIKDLPPTYPAPEDHQCVVNENVAKALNVAVPSDVTTCKSSVNNLK